MLRPRLSDLGANAAVNAIARLLDGGYLLVYAAPQPLNANADTTADVLVVLWFNAMACEPSVGGVAVVKPMAGVVTFSGTAAWFRAHTTAGETVFDGSVGVRGANLNLDTVYLQAGTDLEVHGFTITQAGT